MKNYIRFVIVLVFVISNIHANGQCNKLTNNAELKSTMATVNNTNSNINNFDKESGTNDNLFSASNANVRCARIKSDCHSSKDACCKMNTDHCTKQKKKKSKNKITPKCCASISSVTK